MNASAGKQDFAYADGDRRYVGTLLGALDYTQVAGGLGLRAERISSVAHLRERLAEAAAPTGPLLLDVPITSAPLSERYAAVIEAGRRMVSPFMPSSMHVRSLAPT